MQTSLITSFGMFDISNNIVVVLILYHIHAPTYMMYIQWECLGIVSQSLYICSVHCWSTVHMRVAFFINFSPKFSVPVCWGCLWLCRRRRLRRHLPPKIAPAFFGHICAQNSVNLWTFLEYRIRAYTY